MRKILVALLVTLAVGALLFSQSAYAKDNQGERKTHLLKTTAGVNRTLVNVGQVAMWIYADGVSAITPASCSGLIFPRGNNPVTAAIFEDGLIWGGKVQDGSAPEIRVGGQTYGAGTLGGAITSKGVASFVDRIWRVRRDYATADLTLDAAEVNQITTSDVNEGHIQGLRDQYRADWVEWPVNVGAPFYDAGDDGVYNPQFTTNIEGIEVPVLFPDADEPGYANGDQVVWLVANDLNESQIQGFYGSPPVGIEMQVTLWAYKRADALGNIIFKEFTVIYKGTATTPISATIDSMFLCQWSDPDLGSFGDDFAGSDTTLSLGYCYNSQTNDATYAQVGLPPPAAGYDFFAGPIVPQAGGEAIFNLAKLADHVNLPMTTFAFFAAGSQDSDPSLGGNYNGTLQWWNLLRGFRPRPENPAQPWIDPTTGLITKFRVPGDPVTGSGWIDANPGDRRILLASGPFTMALGDTQQVVVAVLAGLGSDRLSSISVLKFIDRSAQAAFDNLFEIPSPPTAPSVAASEFSGEILLNWGSNQFAVAATENTINSGFVFEGYNIYQLPSPGAPLDQGIKLGTFDVVNEVTIITQDAFDANSGQVLSLPVQFGNNSGITRTFLLDRDRIREKPLINGTAYFFGVTAYSFNSAPNLAIVTLESPPTVLTVVPQTTAPGERLGQNPGGDEVAISDTLASTFVHSANVADTDHAGPSDGNVVVLVSDPSKLTGDTYTVTFDTDTTGGANIPIWNLANSAGEMLLTGQTNQSGDDDYLNVDGVQVKVTGAPQDFKSFQIVQNAAGVIDPPGAGAFAFQGFPTPGDANPDAAHQASGQRWAFHTGADASSSGGGGRGSYSAFLSRSLRGANFDVVVPDDWEMRFTSRGSWSTRAFTTGFLDKVPFELWNIGLNTPNDTSDDYRLIPWFLELAAVGFADPEPGYGLQPFDHPGSGADNDPYTAWIYWRRPADFSAGEAGYDAFIAQIDTTDITTYGPYAFDGTEAIARSVLVCWNCDDVSDGTLDLGAGEGRFPEEGTVLRFISTKPNTPADTFTFSTSGFQPTVNTATAKQDVRDLVNVYPNPYLGFNSSEKNTFQRFVTFSHLPEDATIRIFNLAGALVRTLVKTNPGQFTTWDLQNESGLPVASGIYIANVEMPTLGVTKNIKMAIVQEQQFLRNF